MSGTLANVKLESLIKAPALWSPGAYQGRYTAGNLHEYINGGAERYLGYGFREFYMREYLGGTRGESRIIVELYRMDVPANAYGIFSSDRAGENPGSLGAEAALGEYLLQFCQGEFFVRVLDVDLAGNLKPELIEFGRLISSALPPPAKDDVPELAGRLPSKGLIHQSLVYFHTQNSLNSLIYLGEENILGLGPRVEAVSAEYQPDPRFPEAVVRVVLVCYNDEKSCSRGFDNLLKNKPRLPSDQGRALTHIGRSGRELLLVFGKAAGDWPVWLEAGVWEVR
ncbi:MAG: hypothetical protein JXQ83_09270 [Candidatus Glassbacteria bacterium]|nr:hypothetical protein [Candidatus Glassbacteria bacterium]